MISTFSSEQEARWATVGPPLSEVCIFFSMYVRVCFVCYGFLKTQIHACHEYHTAFETGTGSELVLVPDPCIEAAYC